MLERHLHCTGLSPAEHTCVALYVVVTGRSLTEHTAPKRRAELINFICDAIEHLERETYIAQIAEAASGQA